MKGKYLITTNEWFYAPDGKQYRAVWGEVKILQTKDVLGVDPNRVTANWTLKVGTEQNHILIGGCQIKYSVKCENPPNLKAVEQVIQGEKKVDVPAIYIPEGKGKQIINSMVVGVDDVGVGEFRFRELLVKAISNLDIKPEYRIDFLMRDIDAGVIGSYEIIPDGEGMILILHFKDPSKFKVEIPCNFKQC